MDIPRIWLWLLTGVFFGHVVGSAITEREQDQRTLGYIRELTEMMSLQNETDVLQNSVIGTLGEGLVGEVEGKE